jgi:hypothetical protein
MDSAVQAIAQHGPKKLAIIATKTDVIVDQDVLQETDRLALQAGARDLELGQGQEDYGFHSEA